MWTTTSRERRRRSARGVFPTRSRIASLSASSALLLAACGGGEEAAIPPGTAEALAQRSEQVAEALERGDPCEADRLADELVQAGEGADVPAPHREELLASARSLADRIECPPPPAPVEEDDDEKDKDDGEDEDEEKDDDEDGKGNGKGKGKGKKGKGRG